MKTSAKNGSPHQYYDHQIAALELDTFVSTGAESIFVRTKDRATRAADTSSSRIHFRVRRQGGSVGRR